MLAGAGEPLGLPGCTLNETQLVLPLLQTSPFAPFRPAQAHSDIPSTRPAATTA